MGFGWFSNNRGARDGDKVLSKAQRLLEQGRWAEALSFFDEVLASNPGSEPAGHGAKTCRESLVLCNIEEAEAYRELDSAKAREHLRLALDLAGVHEDLRGRVSALLATLGREGATPRPETAPPRQPLFTKSCSCATPCAEPVGEEIDEAQIDVEDLADFYLESCEPAVKAAFDRLKGSFRTGFVHLQRGEFAEALPHLQQTARAQAREPGAHYALGLLASIEGRNEEAVVQFEQALALDRDFGPALRYLAETLRETGNRKRAMELLSAWVGPHGGDAEARLLLAVNLLETGDATAAAEQARQAQRVAEQTDLRPALLLAKAQRLAGDEQASISTLQGVLARKPDLVEALVELAALLLQQGGSAAERAAEAYKRCYQQDPEHGWWYLIKVAEAYRSRGWEPQARDILSRAREELPEEQEARDAWEAAAKEFSF